MHTDDGRRPASPRAATALPDRELLERLLVGIDPLRTEVVREVCETVDLHGGRPWAVEVAVWDLVGKALDVPLWRLLGGRSERLLAYASSGELLEPEERVARCLALRERGIRAVKLRFHRADWRDDVAVVEAVRDAVGSELEIMVDANQGWRMPGDREPRWDVATAAQCARELEALGVYWLEEPLRTDDVDGYRSLRSRTGIRARRRRAGAHSRGGARPRRPRRRRRRPGRRALRRRHRRLPPRRGARRPARPGLVAAHLVERARAGREPARCARVLDGARSSRCRSTRRPGRPSGATGCCPRRSRSRPTGRSRRRRARASASTSISTRSSSGGSR